MRSLFLFLFCGLSLFASIGKISALNGKIVVDRQKQLLDANIGFDLEEKDLVITDDKSKAQITLNDGTVLSLGKNSKLDINEYVYDEKDSSNSKANFKFAEGTFKSITGAIGKVAPEKFKLETKSASIGIRGTIIVGNQEKIACTHGKIEVTSAGVTQVLNAGMMTNTEQGKPPTPPTKIEGNLLNEVDNNSGSTTENSESTTSQSNESTTQESTSEQNTPMEQNTVTESNNSSISNISESFGDVTNSVNDTASASIAEETRKKAEAFAAEETRKKAEAVLIAQASVLEAIDALNSTIIAASSAEASASIATTSAQTASNETKEEALIAAIAAQTASQVAQEAVQIVKLELVKAQSAALVTSSALSSIEALSSSQIAKNAALATSTALSRAILSAQTAEQESKIITNIPFYNTSVNVNPTQTVAYKTFSVLSESSKVMISTYSKFGSVEYNGMDPVLILLKKDSNGNYVIISRDDDSWVKSENYWNSILNLDLVQGEYKITVSDFPFNESQALSGKNNGSIDTDEIELYFSSTNPLTFYDESIENYSYSIRKNNIGYIKGINSFSVTEENKAQFGALADSKVGASIVIKNLDKNYNGVFLTISDNFLFPTSENIFSNTIEIDDGSSWGYWTSDFSNLSTIRDMKSTWVSGNQVTPPTNYRASFSGQVIGSVKNASNTGYIKLDSNNLFKATIDIGAATITNSIIKFNDSLNNSWNGTFDTLVNTANVNQQKFRSSITNVNNPNISGSLSGKYYGTNGNVQSIGGGFNMVNGSSSANGVFKAREVLP
jgi:hypothetical protein